MTQRSVLSVAIDTASDLAGVALSEDGALLGSATWRTRQNHSKELLPTLDWLLGRHDRAKEDIGAIFVCLGPGSYAGLRVGLSTAKALAYGFGVPIIGVGRLAADAYYPALASGRRVVAVQAAGRAELAWAVYRGGQPGELNELSPPSLSPAAELIAVLEADDLVCGEVEKLDAETVSAITSRGARVVLAQGARVLAVADLAWQRLQRGDVDNADTLVPLYLRAPAIGPQR
jgi:tRNA threonylcarbamoyladenosine biosynthesis protein TsaB